MILEDNRGEDFTNNSEVMVENSHPLDNSLGFLVNVVGRLMKRSLFLKLSESGVTPTQWTVLMCLWTDDGLSFTELGKRLSFDHPTITGIVDRMEREKIVKRRRDHIDRRVVKVYLTPKGKNLESEIADAGHQVDVETVADLSQKDVEKFRSWLLAFREKLSDSTRNIVPH
jgi:DNA-binding MarR family transcriptional regulator